MERQKYTKEDLLYHFRRIIKVIEETDLPEEFHLNLLPEEDNSFIPEDTPINLYGFDIEHYDLEDELDQVTLRLVYEEIDL